MTLKLALHGSGTKVYNNALTYASRTAIGDYKSVGDIDFNDAEPATITDDQNGFLTAGFLLNDLIKISGSVSNDGYYVVALAEAGTLTLSTIHELVDESGATGTITISTPTQGVVLGVEVDVENISIIQDLDNDTMVQVEESLDEDIIRFDVAGTQEAQMDADGLTLKSGASVNEFSTDDTMGGDSDDAIPTEQAVKGHMDTHAADTTDIHGIVDTSKLNTSDANITDHAIVRGDGGAQKIQSSNPTIDDNGHITISEALNAIMYLISTSTDDARYARILFTHARGAGGNSSSAISQYEYNFKIEADEDLLILTNGLLRMTIGSGGNVSIHGGNLNAVCNDNEVICHDNEVVFS